MNMEIKKMIAKTHCYIGRNKPGYVVMHETDNWNPGASALAHANAMRNGNLDGTVHFYVDSKEIYQTLDFQDGAWAVGDGNGRYGISNLNSINIEICVNPESDYYTAVSNAQWLAAKLLKDRGWSADRLKMHYDASRKHCPRRILDEGLWTEFVNKVQKQLSGTGPAATGTKITGKATATTEQMQKYIRSKNPSVAQSVLDIVPQYIQEGKAEGIRGDIAFAQSCLETGNFTFKDSAVTLDQNNFCGMGVTANGMKGNSFPNTKTGIRAQIQHLKAYACAEPLSKECVDPRFQYVERGCAEYVEWLGIQENPKGKGWAAGSGYGSKILNILEAITGIKEEQPKPTPAPTPQPDQTGIYKVQAGSYKDKNLANSLAAVLKNKGFDAIVKEEAGQYKVQCGAFSNKGNATALADKIKGAGFDAIVKGTEESVWVGKCTGDGVNVRKGPGTNYGNITGYPKLNSGNLVDVINKEDGWYQILIDKKYSGFIAEQFVEKV
ncbi:N-acetylmuramoyl-L-alanine amidase [Robinsoniella peoriensis]|uniref:N-acetylmuramoyl-L-alanine amidase n=1 Tax=Robinsoniella peoriensis TaxID=180332 RepID=UPI0009F448E0|nr:N-acetylmuramoyl-L-alanine amidase [Robinsoniella peoriensis]